MKKTRLLPGLLACAVLLLAGCKDDDATVYVTGVTLNKPTAALTVGQTENLTATITPADATNKSVVWSSDTPAVATVSDKGVVTAFSEGEAVITATTADGGKTASCTVTVTSPDNTVNVTGVELDKDETTLMVGQTETLTATIAPADATNKSVTWNSDKPTIADVDENGVVTAITEGKAVITATTADGGKTASCTVTVIPLDVLATITDPNFRNYAQFRMVNGQEGWIYNAGSWMPLNFPKWDTDGDGKLSFAEAAAVEYIGVSGGYPVDEDHKIISLAGIEYFTGLNYLHCSLNSLASLDLSENPELTYLACHANSLTELDLTGNTALNYVNCGDNSLTTLDLPESTALAVLECYGNFLTTLDVTHNTALTDLNCSDNSLASLDVTHNTSLIQLLCRNNSLTAINVTKNTALTLLNCPSNSLTALDVTHNTALTQLDCSYNSLRALDVTHNTALTTLFCQYNFLTALDVTHNTALNFLECYDNSLTALDVSENTNLLQLHCFNNSLTALDVSRNTSLFALDCHGNRMTSLNATSMESLFDEYWLYCGDQTSNGTTAQTLTLTLRDDQKPYWELLKDYTINTGVVLAQ